MNTTNIEWTGSLRPDDGTMVPGFTANPLKYRNAAGEVVWGCVKTSPGCTHCYAETLANRYGRGGPFKQSVMDGLTPFLDEKELHKMLTYKPASGGKCFVGDMTDLFGEWVPDELLDRLFAVFALRRDVTWQVLTKRAGRLPIFAKGYAKRHDGYLFDPERVLPGVKMTRVQAADWPLPNVWLGVSCEDQQRADERIPLLLQTPAAVRFLSVEPLLGPISFTDGPLHPEESTMGEWSVLDLGIKWVIVGGESGPGARPCDVQWVRSIAGQCRIAGVPCFVKQLGSDPRDVDGNANAGLSSSKLKMIDRKGGDMEEWPRDLRVREFPATA